MLLIATVLQQRRPSTMSNALALTGSDRPRLSSGESANYMK
ncbi:hypothetical protein BSU04_04730 [Caballeronia sordidicola]|uniref:Uncharacterized protein n=1 Tax=Caballeronia sordidicola TaxID=196367 RepID=A0A226X8P3_CABSO|nr:hypothetical protein BSU04_04730 [Caballeronia sordidicola]